MSPFVQQLVPILVMYGFVLLLGPFIGFAMWMAFEGDRDHSAASATAADDVMAPVAAAPEALAARAAANPAA